MHKWIDFLSEYTCHVHPIKMSFNIFFIDDVKIYIDISPKKTNDSDQILSIEHNFVVILNIY